VRILTKPSLISKIREELSQPVASERQVVYLLVECRKLLEVEGVLDQYPSLRLCMDWALHPVLDRKECESDPHAFRRLQDGISEIGHHDARVWPRRVEQLSIAAILPEGQNYCEVIRDCPLKATNDGTRIVLEVTALAWPLEMANDIFPGKRVVQWNWKPRDRDGQKDICALV